ncbi:DUF3466 family protein [Thaumasiovibrio sp. DFM-14]|uniref:DUF3466 family protein n=1 Tax=Thaumasiovibrio sp. DFM-14 TaxID=3384792 RepID=UPI0039A1897A
MSNKYVLQLSALALSIAAATHANAALYDVVEVGIGSDVSVYGRAVGPIDNVVDNNCFENDCSQQSPLTASESLRGRMGVPYRDEVAYMGFYRFDIDEDWDLRSYCNEFLGYSTCTTWGEEQWDALALERNAWFNGYESNATAFGNEAALELDAITGDEGQSTNSVVNAIVNDGEIVGITSAAFIANNEGNYPRQFAKRGFITKPGVDPVMLPPSSESIDKIQAHGHTSAFDGASDGSQSYYVGSGAVTVFGSNFASDKDGKDSCTLGVDSFACNNLSFVTQAYVWTENPDGSYAGFPMVDGWPNWNSSGIRLDRAAQASARGVAMVDADNSGTPLPYGVGYTTQYYDRDGVAVAARAAVFAPKADFDGNALNTAQWETKVIPGIDIFSGRDAIRLFTMAVGVNNNGLVIGHAKNELPERRTYPNKSFVYDLTNDSADAKLLGTSDSSLFFNGSNNFASAINNYDEIVGWVDVESVNEISGRPRRQRGYIYRYATDNQRNNEIFENTPVWLLDDLINDGEVDGNANHYRIAQASDINDQGVIVASALKCEGGYDSLAENATCSTSESLVSVTLVPKSTAGSIQQRPTESESVSRSGGSLGWGALSLLALLGLRRRK